MSNANRAVFDEFFVGSALGVADRPWVKWDAVDLRYREKYRVKSSAYVQSWKQDRASQIVFDIKNPLEEVNCREDMRLLKTLSCPF
ncbi:MAG: hypothetical protein AVDCRST_MAG14-2256 [uncultured Rubrobacteraceae bacterium]|uniref:Uncharacterized protein n=1 Tax=uncultured Rubrobacteraceae bacterium TaxID=349277 RepID=A0A6J4R7Y5_9ACTN|nr:MAG: hypothetical protein AVDCRST_MAG14-2256 [uncultured Rubrobacteraceae bacterium]